MKIHHIFIAVFVAAIWGLNFVVVKTGLREIPPFLYGAGRFCVAMLPVLFVKKPNVPWKIILGIGFTLGILKFSLMFGAIYVGVAPGLASLLLQSQVFFSLIVSSLYWGTSLSRQQTLGMIISFVGLAMIALTLEGSSTLLGLGMLLASAMFWAISNILFQKAGRVDMFSLTVWTSIIPPIPMLLASYCFEDTRCLMNPALLSTQSLLCLLFTGGVSTLVGTTLWGVLLKNYDVTRVVPFSLLVPVFGLSSSWLILGEELDWIGCTACAFIFLGLIVNQWSSHQGQQTAQPSSSPVELQKAA